MTVLLLMLLTGQEWQWPINTEFGVTSAFGEYRGARFHMGIDFSTNGAEGMPIKPTRAGRVFRIRALDSGYGRVLYVNHGDGYSSVYAHLGGFGKRISEHLQSLDKNPRHWFGEVQTDFPVSTDEIIAFSGESGAGSAHLHFEVRKNDQPVNPYDLDFPILEDRQKPALVKDIYLYPLDETARVNGSRFAYVAGAGVDKVRAQGRIGVAVLAYISGKRTSRLGVGAIRVFQDDTLVASWEPVKISFDQYRRAGLILDQALSGFGPTQFFYAFDDRASVLPPVAGFQQTAVLDVTEATSLKIETRNPAGVWRARTLKLSPQELKRTPADLVDLPIQATSLAARLAPGNVWLRVNREGTLVTPSGMEGLSAQAEKITPLPKPGSAAQLRWRTDAGNLMRHVGHLPNSDSFDLQMGSWRLRGKDIPLPVSVGALSEPADRKLGGEVLAFVSPVLHFGRHGLPSGNLNVVFDAEGIKSPQQLGYYGWSFNKKRWRFKGRLNEPLRAGHLQPLVVARDLSPPVISKPRVHRWFLGPTLVIPVRDRGSGVDRDTIRVSLDGVPLKHHWDGDRRWIVLETSSVGGPLRVEVRDRAGRSASATLPPPR